MNLLAKRIRKAMEYPYTGMCYAASEAYYHLAGGKEAGLTPVYMPEPPGCPFCLSSGRALAICNDDGPDDTDCPACRGTGQAPLSDEKHWAIREADGSITDLTVEQYSGLVPDYNQAKGCGFLTKEPSKRACILLDSLLQ